ncbi:MAG: 4'-phosphopantetheinyl transferase superfamily protein [Chthoniobacteraceae bacterium]
MMQSGIAETGDGHWLPHESGVAALPLHKNEIHLWRAHLDVPLNKLRALEATLSPDECKRANRFRFTEHRARFVAARGILRSILGIHLRCDPGSIAFDYSEYGKPFLTAPIGTGVEFNVSHSSDLAVYAVASGRQVGVDVEFIKPDGSWLRIAEHYFAAGEFERLSKLPKEQMSREFFELWSEKEARLKALGVGLRYPLGDAGDDSRWSLLKLRSMDGYAAALAFAVQETSPVILRHHFAV